MTYRIVFQGLRVATLQDSITYEQTQAMSVVSETSLDFLEKKIHTRTNTGLALQTRVHTCMNSSDVRDVRDQP